MAKNRKQVFSQRLQQRCWEENITDTELGNAVGSSQNTVNKWRNGLTMPSGEYLARICEHLKVSADWLLGFTDNKWIFYNRYEGNSKEK